MRYDREGMKNSEDVFRASEPEINMLLSILSNLVCTATPSFISFAEVFPGVPESDGRTKRKIRKHYLTSDMW